MRAGGGGWLGAVWGSRPQFMSMNLSFQDSGHRSSFCLGYGTLVVEAEDWRPGKDYVMPYVMFAPTSKQVTYPHPKSVGWGRMFCLLGAMATAKRKWFIDFMSCINKCNQMAQNPVGTV